LLALLAQAPASDVAAGDEANYRRCVALVQSDPERAVASAEDWRLHGGGLFARQCLGQAYARLERWQPAAVAFEQAAREAETEKDPRRADFWVQAGNAWLAANDGVKARNAFDAALAAGSLSEALRGEVLLRIATLDGIQPGALRELDEALNRLLAGGKASKRPSLGGSKAAAEIMTLLGPDAEVGAIERIREANPELADRIAEQMFTFDDLERLDDRSLQSLLREVAGDMLIVALKGADPALRERIFRNMSQRAAETLRDDLESRGPVRIVEVEAQQKEILKIAKRLADEGQIALGGGADAFL